LNSFFNIEKPSENIKKMKEALKSELIPKTPEGTPPRYIEIENIKGNILKAMKTSVSNLNQSLENEKKESSKKKFESVVKFIDEKIQKNNLQTDEITGPSLTSLNDAIQADLKKINDDFNSLNLNEAGLEAIKNANLEAEKTTAQKEGEELLQKQNKNKEALENSIEEANTISPVNPNKITKKRTNFSVIFV
jgi:hypothetical protein